MTALHCPRCQKNRLRPGPAWRGVQFYHCAGKCGWFAVDHEGKLIHTNRPGGGQFFAQFNAEVR